MIDRRVTQQICIKTVLLETPLEAKVLKGLLLAQVGHKTVPVSLLLSGNHREEMSFHLIDCPNSPLVLGFPWFRTHNPHIDWTSGVPFDMPTACILL